MEQGVQIPTATVQGILFRLRCLAGRRAAVRRLKGHTLPTMSLLDLCGRVPFDADAAQALIDAKVDPDEGDEHWSPIHLASHNGNHAAIRLLIAANADPNNRVSDEYATPAFMCRDLASLELLIAAGADLNALNGYGDTIAHNACRRNDFRILDHLFDAGAVDVGARGCEGFTLLHIVCDYVHYPDFTPIFERLLDAGADVNARDNYECTPIHGVCAYWKNTIGLERLIAMGAVVNARRSDGSTVVHCVCARYDTNDALSILIAHGADLNIRDRYGNAPIHYAGRAKTTENLDVLIEAGVDLDAKNDDGLTPTHCAYIYGWYAVLARLIAVDAGLSAEVHVGVTPHNEYTVVDELLSRRCFVLLAEHRRRTTYVAPLPGPDTWIQGNLGLPTAVVQGIMSWLL